METYMNQYWKTRLSQTKAALIKNRFDVYTVSTPLEAKKLALETVIPQINPKIISWAGSKTFIDTGLYKALISGDRYGFIDTFDKNIPVEENLKRRRKALLCDLFITGTNAVTEKGQLVNLDMIGNRVGALTFGPKNVLLFVGRNKIVKDIHAAMYRIRSYAAPTNVLRLEKKNPCVKTACCVDCSSPDRICNTWTITEKSFPEGRVTIILINEDMGL